MLDRRRLLQGCMGAATVGLLPVGSASAANSNGNGVAVLETRDGEDLIGFIKRTQGRFDGAFYRQLLGAANSFKEGDLTVGVAAADESSRQRARQLLARTSVSDIDSHAFHRDTLYRFILQHRDTKIAAKSADMTVGGLKEFLLQRNEDDIQQIMPGLSSDAISCVVKLMTNEELIAVGAKIFNPLPGSQIGANGYLGARIQPNSPTDNVADIRWQVFDAWAYGVGDVLLGTNPVSSTAESVFAVEDTLKDILTTFGIDHLMPHCVLSHVDVQAEVETAQPNSTALWFQSIAGCDTANQTFDISVDKMVKYAQHRTGRFGMYFETGQGADFTNGHSHGFDMMMHESRKYGFARGLSRVIGEQLWRSGARHKPWVHLNDVAGFIGPEVFRTREQLVRCCLEDIVMGKLHGLCLGLDVCSTLHMDVTLADLDWCLDQIMPANPAYLMALPTKIDPMLGYLTTGYQDHVRLRERFGYRVNDAMWEFFQQLGVIDADGRPTQHFGDPTWVYLQYRRRKADGRSEEQIQDEAQQQMAQVRGRGVFLATGHGTRPADLEPDLATLIKRVYDDAKLSIWAELHPEFLETIPNGIFVTTRSMDRNDYILHPTTGEEFGSKGIAKLKALREKQDDKYDVQVVISDGLNALAISEPNHLAPFLNSLRAELEATEYQVAPANIIVQSGRVRAGYRIGETLFANTSKKCAIVHIIGERPGTGHRTFSAYFTSATGNVWNEPGKVDHDITKVVSGIATTALHPETAARDVVKLLKTM